MTTPERDTSSLGYIDGLRGIAILMVILVHTSQRVVGLHPITSTITDFAQLGVQLFFVASSFTLCLSHERRAREPNANAAFYVRRFFRIAPLYYCAIALYGIVQWLSPSEYMCFSVTNVLANAIFIHGFIPAANNCIVPGGWSIGTEMAFYAIFPLLFAGMTRVARCGPIAVATAVAVVQIACLAVGYSLRSHPVLKMGNNTFLYFSLLGELPVFLVGMAAFFIVTPPPRTTNVTRLARVICGRLRLGGRSLAGGR